VKLTINTDGGNAWLPKPGALVTTASAFFARILDEEVACGSTTGHGTTNTAEYGGLQLALEHLTTILETYPDIDSVGFVLDSQVVTYQMTGRYSCKEPELRKLHDQVVETMEERYPGIDFEFEWIRREGNQEADKLCDLALEGLVKSDIFQPFNEFTSVRVKNVKAKDKPSLGQLWKAGKLKGIVTCRVSVRGDKCVNMCNACGAPWDECGCPPLKEVQKEIRSEA